MAKETEGLKLRSKPGLGQEQEGKAHVGSARNDSNQSMAPTLIILFYYSLAMLILPLGSYFLIARYIVESPTISAVGAIVMVQFIVAAYIYRAWTDEKKQLEFESKLKKR